MGKPGVTNIRGKDYQTVPLRVAQFRTDHPAWGIGVEFIAMDEKECIIRASIVDETGRCLAQGTAQETKGSSNINKTSWIENCETSAVGRALAFLGYVGEEALAIASAEEVAGAIEQQESDNSPEVTSKPVEVPAEHQSTQAEGLPFDKNRALMELAEIKSFNHMTDWYRRVRAHLKPAERPEVGAAFADRCEKVGLEPDAIREAIA